MKMITNFYNWFVIRVPSGKEDFVKKNIDKNSMEQIEMIVFLKEVIHTKKKLKKKSLSLYFPVIYLYIRRLKQY